VLGVRKLWQSPSNRAYYTIALSNLPSNLLPSSCCPKPTTATPNNIAVKRLQPAEVTARRERFMV
jgi:hypothetical protein